MPEKWLKNKIPQKNKKKTRCQATEAKKKRNDKKQIKADSARLFAFWILEYIFMMRPHLSKSNTCLSF